MYSTIAKLAMILPMALTLNSCQSNTYNRVQETPQIRIRKIESNIEHTPYYGSSEADIRNAPFYVNDKDFPIILL